MPTIRQEIERFTTSPAWQGRYGLLIVAEGAYRELEDAGLPADARLAECGYKSVVVNGVPVIYSGDYIGDGFVPVDQELIDLLARKE